MAIINKLFVIIDKEGVLTTVRDYDADTYMGIYWDRDFVKNNMLIDGRQWNDRNKLYNKSEVKIHHTSKHLN